VLKNLLLISSVAFLLSACSSVEKLKVFSSPVENKIIAPSDPKPLLLDKLHFDVVNKDNLQKFLKELQKEQNTEEFVFYAITPKTYELLALNMQEIKRFILQQKDIIIFYKEATKPSKEGNQNSKEK
jgi:starvation-inducible outer membrane lipoprotein|tara:strand:+ start:203 stop:583 length:381 start_codon:yes stop_codon:yes gene_type:complete